MQIEKQLKQKIDLVRDDFNNYSNGIKFQLSLDFDSSDEISKSNFINHINLLLLESEKINKSLLELQEIAKS